MAVAVIVKALFITSFLADQTAASLYGSGYGRQSIFIETDIDKVLTSNQAGILQVFHDVSLNFCAQNCIADIHCLSMNFKSTAIPICQILQFDKNNKSVTLQNDIGWSHYEPSGQVASRCLRATCAPGFRCVESFFNTDGYKCVEKRFIIKHFGGLCISFRTADNMLQLDHNCTEEFRHTADNNLLHIATGKCILPKVQLQNAKMTLTDDCSSVYTRFQHLAHLSIRQMETGMCIHPLNGYTYPAPGSEIVIYSGCADTDRLKFMFIWTN